MTIGFMNDNWNYFMLMYTSIIVWLLLDLKFNYIKVNPVYKFFITLLVIPYPVISFITEEPVTSLMIIAFIPILPLFNLTVIRRYKYCIIPFAMSVIAFIYVSYGLFTAYGILLGSFSYYCHFLCCLLSSENNKIKKGNL